MNTLRLCDKRDYPELAALWERSVRATHAFLSEDDIAGIREALIPLYFPNVELHCVEMRGKIAGFIGLAGRKIEMLFVDDCRRGQGIGSRLIDHAIAQGADSVDVNEQNPLALSFYISRGFRVVDRDEYDSDGRPFPILHMSLRRPATGLSTL